MLLEAGFQSETVKLSEVDVTTLAALTGTSSDEWQALIGTTAIALVLVSVGPQLAAVVRLLHEYGAREIVGPAAQTITTPAPNNRGASAGSFTIAPGMTVMSAERREVGRVKRVHRGVLLVDRPLRPDVWVPLTAVERVIESWVVLSLPFADVDVAASFLLKR